MICEGKKEARPQAHVMLCDLDLGSGGQSQVLGGQWCPLRLSMKREPVVCGANGGMITVVVNLRRSGRLISDLRLKWDPECHEESSSHSSWLWPSS